MFIKNNNKLRALLTVLIIACAFTIQSKAAVIPCGGENGEYWMPNTSHQIKWDTTDFHGNINLYLWNGNTSQFSTIATNVSAAAGEYTWYIPTDAISGDYFRIKVLQNDSTQYYQFSETFFPIYPASNNSINIISSVESTDNTTLVRVSPNPGNQLVEVSFLGEETPRSLFIFNTQGENLIQVDFQNEKNISIPVASLPQGIYFVKINLSNNRNIISKFIISR